jgi:hypothetical protein
MLYIGLAATGTKRLARSPVLADRDSIQAQLAVSEG